MTREELKAEIARLWGMGWTARAIAASLSITRNMVIGIAHRMKLAARPSPINLAGQPARIPLKPRAEASKRKRRAKPAIATTGQGCRWIEGEADGARTVYCDEPRVEGKPYCQAHCRDAYRGTRSVKDLLTEAG